MPDSVPDDDQDREPGDPTPAEIAERTAEIRRGWSPAEHERRRRGLINSHKQCRKAG